jgi:hypothetical protein
VTAKSRNSGARHGITHCHTTGFGCHGFATRGIILIVESPYPWLQIEKAQLPHKHSSGILGVGGVFYHGRPAVIKRQCIRSQGFGVEAGSNTSTVNLRVVGGDKKGSLESERVKYGHESHGTRTRK